MEMQELCLGQPRTHSPAPQRAPWDGQASPTKSPQLFFPAQTWLQELETYGNYGFLSDFTPRI